jgi:hypothetical protein
VADVSAAQLSALLDLADDMKDGPIWWTAAPNGHAIVCPFDKPSACKSSSIARSWRSLVVCELRRDRRANHDAALA